MNDPKRWADDPLASDELRAALGRVPSARGLDPVTRARVGARVGRLGAASLAAGAWFSVKSAAALGIAGGVAAASVLALVEHAAGPSEAARPPSHAKSSPGAESARAAAAPSSEPPSMTIEPPSAPERHQVPTPSVLGGSASVGASVAPPSASANLAEESRLLERARRALQSAPAAALAVVAEHAERFPTGQLTAERRLLEVEALYRVGRRAEARTLAARLRAGGGDDLYSERVERLLQKIDDGSRSP